MRGICAKGCLAMYSGALASPLFGLMGMRSYETFASLRTSKTV